MTNQEIFILADKLKDAKDRKKELEAQVKELTAEMEQLDRDLLDAVAEEEVEKPKSATLEIF
jgi:septal ring factor EnvC (AmiA/AmiB activator)